MTILSIDRDPCAVGQTTIMGKKAEDNQSSSDENDNEELESTEAAGEKEKSFVPINEIEFKFLLRDPETVVEGLTKFVQTSEAHSDGIPCSDIIVKYLKSSPNCEELFALLDKGDTSFKPNQICLVFKCLEKILTRIRTDLPKCQTAGDAAAQKILVVYMGKIYKCLQIANKSNMIKSTIQFLISLAMLSEKSKKTLQTRLNFSHVPFAAFFKRRNRKDTEDVRSCMVLLTLAFLVNSDNSVVSSLVQQKSFIQMVISGLKFDAKEVVVDVLSTLSDKVVKNINISKTDKVKLFSEVVLRQLTELHKWQGPQAWTPDAAGRHEQDTGVLPEEVSAVADVVDSFLQDLCCSHKHGIGFYDKSVGTGTRSQNQLLSHFLTHLSKSMDEPRSSTLMINILVATPDLLHRTLTELQLSLEPRWSTSWGHRLEWLVMLYNTLPDTLTFVDEKFRKVLDEHTMVAMATVFCLPPPKVALLLSQSLKHDDIRVRHSYLELVETLARKACSVRKSLVSWIKSGHGRVVTNADTVIELFTATVLKALPPLSQLFICADKVLALTSVSDMAGQEAKEAIEQQLCVDLGHHLRLLLQILSLYQTLTPSLLAQRPRDVSKLVQAVSDHIMVASQATHTGHSSNGGDITADGQNLNSSKLDEIVDAGASVGRTDNGDAYILPQLYLFKLLSQTDVTALSLGREGLLEKLLVSASHNQRYMDVSVSLICKMLASMDVFAGHQQELMIWLRNALTSSGVGTKAGPCQSKKSPSKKGKKADLVKDDKAGQTGVMTNQGNVTSCVISYLARCLSTLINNPAPYVDRATEALVDGSLLSSCDGGGDEDGRDEKMDVSNVGTNEAAREAILMMDDEELDKLVSSTAKKEPLSATTTMVGKPSSAKNVTTDIREEDLSHASSVLPVLPLVLVALDHIKHNDKANESEREYLSKVLVELVHSLSTRESLVVVVERSGLGSFLCAGVRQYIFSCVAHKKCTTASSEALTICDPFIARLIDLRSIHYSGIDSPGSRLEAHKIWTGVEDMLNKLTKSQLVHGLRQVLLYLGEAVAYTGKLTNFSMPVVQLYRLIAQALVDNIVRQDDQIQDTRHDSMEGSETKNKIKDLISSLDSQESFAHTAISQLLMCPSLLKLLSPSEENVNKKLDENHNEKVYEVICLFKHVLLLSCEHVWFQNEMDMINIQVDVVVRAMLQKPHDGGIKPVKSKKRRSEGGDDCHSKDKITQCCLETLQVLYPNLGLVGLTSCIIQVLKLSFDQLKGGIDNKQSGIGKLLVDMLKHWTDKTVTILSPDVVHEKLCDSHMTCCEDMSLMAYDRLDADESLVSRLTKHQKQKTQNVMAKLNKTCLKLNIAPLFDEVCGVKPQEFKLFFDLAFSCNSKIYQECAAELVNKVPLLTSVCCDSLPSNALSSPVNLIAAVGTSIAAMLVKSDRRVFESVNLWLQTSSKKALQKKMCWLPVAFLSSQYFSPDACQIAVSNLQKSCSLSLNMMLTSGNSDSVMTLQKLCSLVGESDNTFVEEIIVALVDVMQPVQGRQDCQNLYRFELLSTCATLCPSFRLKYKGDVVDTGAILLDLSLQHLNIQAAEKTRSDEWENHLICIAFKLVKKNVKVSLVLPYWSSLVKNTLKHMYKNPQILLLLSSLAPNVYTQAGQHPVGTASPKQQQLLPARTLFQMVSSHTAFFQVMMTEELPRVKAGVVHLLFTLAQIDSSCYNKQMCKVFVGAYAATLSVTDQRLLHMIENTSTDKDGKFECPKLWGKKAMDQHSVSQALGSSLHAEVPVAQIIAQLDASKLRTSTINFPLQRSLGKQEPVSDSSQSTEEFTSYDPRFLIRLLAQIVTPDKAVPLRQFVDKGCLGYLLVALSSHSLSCRLLAYRALNDFHLHAHGSRWAERTETCFLLDLINAARTQDAQKISFVVTLFFSRVARLLLYPADPLYMPIMRFLVARPQMDLRSVPEFYKLFFSPGTNFKQERNWIISLLGEGLRESSDYWLYQKKSVFRVILSFYSSTISDATSQRLVLSVVKRACNDKSLTVQLVKHHGLLAWLASAIDGLASRPEQTEDLCDIVHSVWSSLTSYQHLDANSEKVEETAEIDDSDHRNGVTQRISEVEKNEEEEDSSNEDNSSSSSSDTEDESDNDDDDVSDEESEEEDMEEEDDSSGKETGLQHKRKKKSLPKSESKRLKLSAEKSSKSPNKNCSKKNGERTDERNVVKDMGEENATEKVVNGRERKTSTKPPSVPKASIVEIGIIVKKLLWNLNVLSVRSVAKVVEVVGWLIEHSLHSSPHYQSNQLFDLSAVNACLILHRLGLIAQIAELTTTVEAALADKGYDVGQSSLRGGHLLSKKTREEKKKAGDEEAVDVKDVAMNEDSEETKKAEEGDEADVLVNSLEEGKKLDVCEVEEKIRARKLLRVVREIVRVSGCIQFV